MNTSRRHAVAALVAAGLLWGTTVPLSKLALAVAGSGLAHRRAVRPGRRGAAAGRAAAGACGGRWSPGCWRSGRGRVRGVGHRAERRDHPDQRHPRGPADRGGAGAGRDHRRGMAPQRGPAAGLAGLRGLAGRGRPGHRGRRAAAAARACAATGWCWSRWCCRPRSPWRRAGCCPAGTRSRSPRCSSWGPRWARWPSPPSPRACPPSRRAPGPCWPWRRWRWAARWRRSRCSPTGRAGCRPRSPGRSSTSSRWSARSRASCSSATRRARGSWPGAWP